MIHYRAGRTHFSVLLALLGVLLGITPVSAQEPFEPVAAGMVAPDGPYDAGAIDVRHIDLLNHLPGGFGYAIQIYENHAYVVTGGELAVFDIQDPNVPTLVSFLQLESNSPGSPQMLAILDDRLFIYVDNAIWTLSVADPAHPQKLQETWLDGARPTAIYAYGDYLYLSLGSELWTMAIGPDGSLAKTGTLMPPPDTFFLNLLFDQTVAYISFGYRNDGDAQLPPRVDLAVADLSDPSAPTIVATLERQGGLKFVVSPERLYVFTHIEMEEGVYPQGWVVYDRTDPRQPVELGHVVEEIGYYTPGTIAWGSSLLIPDASSLRIADLTDPANPQVTVADIRANALAVDAGRLYAAGNGLHIYDATVLPEVTQLGAFNIFLNGPSDTFLRDEHVLVADGDGLNVFDASSPHDLVQVAFVPNESIANYSSLVAQEDFLYTSSGLIQNIVDISRPDRLAVVGFNQTATTANILAAGGNIVYLDSYDPRTISLMDTSSASLWQKVSTLDVPDSLQGLMVHEDRVYATAFEESLLVFDVGDPTAPRRVATFPQFDNLQLREIGGDYLYATDWVEQQGNRLRVLDISNRNRPVEVNRLPLQSGYANINEIVYEAPYLYVADSNFGIYVLDAADPRLLLEAGRYESVGGVYQLDVDERRISAVTYGAGLSLYQFTPLELTRRIEPAGGSLEADDGKLVYTLPEGMASTAISLTHALRSFGPSSVLPPLAATDVVFRNGAVNAATGNAVEPGAAYTITVSYGDISGPFPPETLRLYRWTGKMWEAQESSVDIAKQEVTATTEYFGVFALMAEPHQLRLPFVRSDAHVR